MLHVASDVVRVVSSHRSCTAFYERLVGFTPCEAISFTVYMAMFLILIESDISHLSRSSFHFSSSVRGLARAARYG